MWPGVVDGEAEAASGEEERGEVGRGAISDAARGGKASSGGEASSEAASGEEERLYGPLLADALGKQLVGGMGEAGPAAPAARHGGHGAGASARRLRLAEAEVAMPKRGTTTRPAQMTVTVDGPPQVKVT